MTVSIRIDVSRKQKLDCFLTKLFLQEGKKLTLKDAVGLMIDYALENQEEFVRKIKRDAPVQFGLGNT